MPTRLYVQPNTSVCSDQNIYMFRSFGRDRTTNVPALPTFFKYWIRLNIAML